MATRFSNRANVVLATALVCACAGCLGSLGGTGKQPLAGGPAGPPAPNAAAWIDNPLFVANTDHKFLWEQLVDAVDDYFWIAREQRVRQIGSVITEGRIYTKPQIGSTLLEPWRRDSTPGFEKLQSTLQSIRRQALVRLTPTSGGYFVEVIVQKELEDVAQPENSTVGGATLRHDGSVVRTTSGEAPGSATLGWIPQGRDLSLEQQMLAEIKARIGI